MAAKEVGKAMYQHGLPYIWAHGKPFMERVLGLERTRAFRRIQGKEEMNDSIEYFKELAEKRFEEKLYEQQRKRLGLWY